MTLSTKDPLEKVVITFDFTSVLETISNPVVYITEKGSDVLITTMTTDIPQLLGNKVLQLFVGGENNVKYIVSCMVDVAATGERFVAKDILTIKI